LQPPAPERRGALLALPDERHQRALRRVNTLTGSGNAILIAVEQRNIDSHPSVAARSSVQPNLRVPTLTPTSESSVFLHPHLGIDCLAFGPHTGQ
jgi:hypothetical protein